jgi:hypothetical protein
MSGQQLAEIRLAQPAVDVGAGLDADRFRNPRRAPQSPREKGLAEASLADQSLDAVTQPRFGTLDDFAVPQKQRARQSRRKMADSCRSRRVFSA